MNVATLILVAVLGAYTEMNNGATGPGTSARRRAMLRAIQVHTGKLDWDATIQFNKAMKAALAA
ncbi:hypothetical protein [Myxococcus phage Mx1]|nr:hypothetical protein [Myxococcus phage Mx1]